MASRWTAEKVLALAPDSASAKAGQGLSSPKKWATLGSGGGLVWGECQGSGASPYQTVIDPDGPAFSCSCPSRKIPCKHALGLLLAWASSPGAVAEAALPPWVASWKLKRDERAEKAKEKLERAPTAVDPVAQAKREAARAAKVAAGLDDLSLWLADLVRQGFGSLASRPRNVWDEQARRMVDAQAPGVARRLRQIDEMTLAGDGWQAALLDRLARLYLLGEGYRRIAGLPPEVTEDVRTAVGFPADLDAVRSGPGVRDRWQVIGQCVSAEDRLVVGRTWMIGRDSGRPALVLDFAAGGKPLELSLPPGTVVDADLAFFPSSAPLRALVKERHGTSDPLETLTGGTSIVGAFAAYGAALAKNPWLEFYPAVVEGVTLREHDGSWSARDASGAVMPLSPRFSQGWELLALTGGSPLALAGEFDGESLEPLGASLDGFFRPLWRAKDAPAASGPASTPVEIPLLAGATASAIVGVDRKPPPAQDDERFGRLSAGLEGREPSSRLLALAAAAGLYGRAGRKPPVDTTPVPETCPPDDRRACPDAAAGRLRAMLGSDYADVLPEWLGLLARSGDTIPHDLLVGVLESRQSRDLPDDALRASLGVRGRWLASKNPRWANFGGEIEVADPERTWEVGDRRERLASLRWLRQTDPARGLALVASTFARDPADERAAFVGELATGLSMGDEPFLEAALDDRGKDVRRQAAEMLRRLPDSRLCARMVERARGILRWENGGLVVVPPTSCDKAAVRDGVEAKPAAHLKFGERTWWLRQVVSAAPAGAVSAFLGVAPVEAVASGLVGQWAFVLRWAWADSAARQGDADWAEALLDSRPLGTDSLDDFSQDRALLSVLPPERRDAFLLRALCSDPGLLERSHPAFLFFDARAEVVGPEVARELLGRVRAHLERERREFASEARRSAALKASNALYDHKYHDHSVFAMIQRLSDVVPYQLADEAAVGVDLGEAPRPYYADAYGRMLERLRFRRDMHREFAS